jgi:hypothetical protein
MSTTAGGTGTLAAAAAAGAFNDLPFWYLLNPPALTANQQNIGASFQVDNDSDFLWDRLVSAATGIYSVYIIDRYTSRPLSPSPASPIDIENLAGIAALPFWLPKPYLIRRTSTIQAIFNDRSGAGNTIQLAFVGLKVGQVLP